MSANVVQIKDAYYKIQDGDKERLLLSNINCEFEKGRITLVSGPSGSGKTTLLYSIAGLLGNGFTGNVIVNDTEIYQLSESQRDHFRLYNMSMVFQNLNLFSFMDVEQNIFVPFYAKNKPIDESMKKLVSFYLEVMGLGHIQNKQLKNLSGGEQQRVAIIRAIIDNPCVVLCDEPTASLDKDNSVIFYEHLRKLIDQTQLTVVIVTHDKLAQQFADNVLVMEDGAIRQ